MVVVPFMILTEVNTSIIILGIMAYVFLGFTIRREDK